MSCETTGETACALFLKCVISRFSTVGVRILSEVNLCLTQITKFSVCTGKTQTGLSNCPVSSVFTVCLRNTMSTLISIEFRGKIIWQTSLMSKLISLRWVYKPFCHALIEIWVTPWKLKLNGIPQKQSSLPYAMSSLQRPTNIVSTLCPKASNSSSHDNKLFWTNTKNLTMLINLKAPITTKVVCFCHLVKCFRSLYDKLCGPRSDYSYRSSLIWAHTVCFYS